MGRVEIEVLEKKRKERKEEVRWTRFWEKKNKKGTSSKWQISMRRSDSWKKTRREKYRARKEIKRKRSENEKKGGGRNERRKKKYKVTDLCREMAARGSHRWLHRLRGTALNSLMEKTTNPGAIWKWHTPCSHVICALIATWWMHGNRG